MTGHNCEGDGCPLCAALSHTDLDGMPDANWKAEPKLVLVPMSALRQMQNIVNQDMPAHLDTDTLDRFGWLSTILDTMLPAEVA